MVKLKGFSEPCHVTQPLLPDLEEMLKMINLVWESKQLSNHGKMVSQLEKELERFLDIDNISVFCNGTIALQVACKALRLSGEVITTPFTFAATTNALALNQLQPVFCDIEEDTFNINPDLIEAHITEKTTAILPVHVFGNPCNVEKIQQIANKYGLKVLYDAAHAFGVTVNNKPIISYGDISMLSFHATKIYHTLEGGALAYNDPYLKERLYSLRNFGFDNNKNVVEPGTNGKLNEVQAIVGILLLKIVDGEIQKRRLITNNYRELLSGIPGIKVSTDIEGVKHNYPYLVIRINHEDFGLTRDELYEKLKEYNIISRKYFYPICSNFQCYKDHPSAAKENLPIANKVAGEVLALPLHGKMSNTDVEKICAIIKKIRPV